MAASLTEKGAVLVSTDRIRAEVFGDEEIQYTEDWLRDQGYAGAQDIRSKAIFANSRLFDLAYERCSKKLAEGADVVMDATSCSRKARRFILDNVSNADRCVCMVIAAPFEICCMRNRMRSRIVPDEAMKRISEGFEFPSKEEGFDEIIYCGDKKDIDYGEGKNS